MTDSANPCSRIGDKKPAAKSHAAGDFISDWKRWSRPERIAVLGFMAFWISVQSSMVVLLGH